MGQVTVKINGYAYTVICEDGQEQHLQDSSLEKLLSNTPTSVEMFQNTKESISIRLDERHKTSRYLTGLLSL
ncbi:cell division protein ZapA [Entomobacter blattae]|uniref:Uncharacterized protein n=1 Tax=Entomobacter blattae TaxID=2762277 RepID=A0A7H1NQP4_9PROT|nr:cell division protein ZapA [Entomobacter blattae]QNT78104.1 hypothetical protein JGUZn3_08720 [Entomobacter blattae]